MGFFGNRNREAKVAAQGEPSLTLPFGRGASAPEVATAYLEAHALDHHRRMHADSVFCGYESLLRDVMGIPDDETIYAAFDSRFDGDLIPLLPDLLLAPEEVDEAIRTLVCTQRGLYLCIPDGGSDGCASPRLVHWEEFVEFMDLEYVPWTKCDADMIIAGLEYRYLGEEVNFWHPLFEGLRKALRDVS